MTTESGQQVERKELHPTSFYVMGIPLPTQDQPAQGVSDAIKMTYVGGMRMPVADPEKMKRATPGLHAAVVTEVGPLPEDRPREIHAPFEAGATIHYPEAMEIRIGEMVMVHIDQVLCWEDA